MMPQRLLLTLALSTLGAAAATLNPIELIRSELDKGSRTIRVPAGQYRLLPPDNAKAYITLANVSDVTIDLTGVEIVGQRRTRMVDLIRCRNVTLRGLTIDYETLPFTQATIRSVGPNGEWDVQVLPGYPTEDIISADICWPIQAYGRDSGELVNPMRFRDSISVIRTGHDTYRISGGLDRRGNVGDIAVWSLCEPNGVPTVGSAIALSHCADITLEDITVYSTPRGCGFLDMYGHGNTYRRCRLIRRPPETDLQPRTLRRLRSGNHDAFMSRCASKGPRYLDCVAMYHCDDCVNISGMYSFITAANGSDARIVVNWAGFNFQPGNTCQLMTDDGQCREDLTVVAVRDDGDATPDEKALFQTYGLWPGLADSCRKAYRLTLDKAVPELRPGSVIISAQRHGSDFIITGCRFGHSRARGLLIKASDGLIEDNLIEACSGSGLQMSPEYEWMEGGCSSRVTVRNNTFRANGDWGAVAAGASGRRQPLAPNAHRQLQFVGNRFLQSPQGLSVSSCTGLVIRDNRFELPPDRPHITVQHAQDVIQENNGPLEPQQP